MNYLHYVFYRSYDLVGLTGTYDLAWGASHFLSIFCNVIALNIYLKLNVEFDILYISSASVFIFIVSHVLLYFVMLRNNKYLIIIKKYSQESNGQKTIGRIVTALLFIVSIANCL